MRIEGKLGFFRGHARVDNKRTTPIVRKIGGGSCVAASAVEAGACLVPRWVALGGWDSLQHAVRVERKLGFLWRHACVDNEGTVSICIVVKSVSSCVAASAVEAGACLVPRWGTLGGWDSLQHIVSVERKLGFLWRHARVD